MTAERTAARREENLFLRGQFSGKYGVCVCVCLSCLLFVPETNSGIPPPFYVVSIIFFPVGNRRVPEKQRQKAARGNVFLRGFFLNWFVSFVQLVTAATVCFPSFLFFFSPLPLKNLHFLKRNRLVPALHISKCTYPPFPFF